MSDVRFEKRNVVDTKTNQNNGEVVVVRRGREVAVLPDAGRLDRALSLDLEEATWVAGRLDELLKREPTSAEQEFWQAVVEFKREEIRS